MAAPQHVPSGQGRPRLSYSSPPARERSWTATRPGELDGPPPEGGRLGAPGPDQGFALTLANRQCDSWNLAPGLHRADAVAGVVAVALKRASLFGRAPVADDIRVGAALWGFDDGASLVDGFVDLRRRMFAEAHHPHYPFKSRAIADAADSELLRRPLPAVVAEAPSFRQRLVEGLSSAV